MRYQFIAVIALILSMASVVFINHVGMKRMSRPVTHSRLDHEVRIFVAGNSEANAILTQNPRVQHLWEGGAHFAQRFEQILLVKAWLPGRKVIINLDPAELVVERDCAHTQSVAILYENASLSSDFRRYVDRLLSAKRLSVKYRHLITIIKHYLSFSRVSMSRLFNDSRAYTVNGARISEKKATGDFEREAMWKDPRWSQCASPRNSLRVIDANLEYLQWLSEFLQETNAGFRIVVTPLHPLYRERANKELDKLFGEERVSIDSLMTRLAGSGLPVASYLEIYDDNPQFFSNGNHLTETGESSFSTLLLDTILR